MNGAIFCLLSPSLLLPGPPRNHKTLDLVLQGQKYSASSVQEWTDAICSQTVGALRGISGSFKYTGAL